MRRGRELRIDAYRDGQLSERERGSVERVLDSDPDSASRLRETDALGRAIRTAWTDGATPPPTEYVIAALRPELARADAELAFEGSPRARLRELLRPLPVALAGAAAALLLLAWPTVTGLNGAIELGSPAGPELVQRSGDALAEAAVAVVDAPAAIYDLAQGESPLMIFEGFDGSTVIWILEEEDNVSLMAVAAEGWA